jgi:hypothetical protein
LEDYRIVAIPRKNTSTFAENDTATFYTSEIEYRSKSQRPAACVVTNPVDGVYWRTVGVKFEQKFSLTETGAQNHIQDGTALNGSQIKQRNSTDAFYVSIKIVKRFYGAWQSMGLPPLQLMRTTWTTEDDDDE